MLTYHFGVMRAAKSLALLVRAHNLARGGHAFLVLKGHAEGANTLVATRAGVPSRTPDACLSTGKLCAFDAATSILRVGDVTFDTSAVVAVLVDEVQFLDPAHVDVLRALSRAGIDVHAYGLRTDFRGRLFPASAALFAATDRYERLDIECQAPGCRALAAHNMRVDAAGAQVHDGAQIDATSTYLVVCEQHFGLPG
jgi:thymidine kinase